MPGSASDEKDFAGLAGESLRIARALRGDPGHYRNFWDLAQELGMALPDVGDPTMTTLRAQQIVEWRERTKAALSPLLLSHRVEIRSDRNGVRFRWIGRRRGRKRTLPPGYPWDSVQV